MKNYLLSLLLCILFASCTIDQYKLTPIPGFEFQPQKAGGEGEKFKEKYEFFFITTYGTLEEMELLLKKGQDPNCMKYPPAESSWHARNPLWRSTRDYHRAALLIEYGADVKRRPYIAAALSNKIISERYPDESLLRYAGTKNEKEVYERVKLFINAGADPNFRGGINTMLRIPIDANYRRYFNKHGILPINIAIKYNAFSIVELLLEHGSILDEESLVSAIEATKTSGHTDMEDYIKKLLKKQEKGDPLFSR
jgi:hypothetical protein